MAKIETGKGMTFNVGKAKLTDKTDITFPRQSIVPGLPIFKDGKNMENGTYQTEDGREFTVAAGLVGKIGKAAPAKTQAQIDAEAKAAQDIIDKAAQDAIDAKAASDKAAQDAIDAAAEAARLAAEAAAK